MRREDVHIKLYRGAYYAVWRDGGETKRRALRTKDRKAAERALIDFLKTATAPLETIADIMQAFLEDRQGHLGLARAKDAWKRLRLHFGHLRSAHVTRQICREYTAMRRRRVKDGTIIKELAVLRTALRWQNKATPAIIEMPPEPPPRDRYLTREEYRALREAAAQTPHCEVFVILAYTTAGRKTAILELTWDRIDFARGLIRLGNAVGNKGRATVPMTPRARAVLERAREAALTDHVIEFSGKPVRSIRKTFSMAVARAGLLDVSPHVLRHTAAVHMVENGVPMSEVSQYLGHTSTFVTERVYGRYSPDYLRRAAAALE
jgi:integrase